MNQRQVMLLTCMLVRFIVEHIGSETAISIERIKIESGKDEALSLLSNLIQSSIWSEHEFTKPFRLMRNELSV